MDIIQTYTKMWFIGYKWVPAISPNRKQCYTPMKHGINEFIKDVLGVFPAAPVEESLSAIFISAELYIGIISVTLGQ